MMDFIIRHDIAKLARVETIAFEAMVEQAQVLKNDANKLVPEADSDLRLSSKVTPSSSQKVAIVSYDTPYAVRQHEDLSLNHPDPRNPKSRSGRKARWLEITAQTNASVYVRRIADKIRGRMNRGGL